MIDSRQNRTNSVQTKKTNRRDSDHGLSEFRGVGQNDTDNPGKYEDDND